MKRKLLFIVIAVIVLSLVFAACDNVNVTIQQDGSGKISISGDGSGSDGGSNSDDANGGIADDGGASGSGESSGSGSGSGSGESGGSGSGSGSGGGAGNGSSGGAYVIDGDHILFGSYPQTKVTDEGLLTALAGEAGTFPDRTEEDYKGWTSYKYYRGANTYNTASNVFDFMFYKDVTYQGEKYRGVYMVGYRPRLTTHTGTTDNTFQDDNGYKFGRDDSYLLYWFKFEPISWRILNSENGVALVIADIILDSQAFLNEANYIGVDGKGNSILMNSNEGVPDDTYANNYAYSSIRAWLNDDFYNTAFTSLQKSLIALTNVDNGITSSCPVNGNAEVQWNNGTRFLCENTEDYVFLPSEVEITTAAYGFSEFMERYANDQNRVRLYSDYAAAQGLWIHSTSYTKGVAYGSYWLRSPRHYATSDGGYGEACIVNEEGYCASGNYVCYTDQGVVPMLNVRLS